jgi:hypothetical protein
LFAVLLLLLLLLLLLTSAALWRYKVDPLALSPCSRVNSAFAAKSAPGA